MSQTGQEGIRKKYLREVLGKMRKFKEEWKNLFSVFNSILPGREDNHKSMLHLVCILSTPALLQTLGETNQLVQSPSVVPSSRSTFPPPDPLPPPSSRSVSYGKEESSSSYSLFCQRGRQEFLPPVICISWLLYVQNTINSAGSVVQTMHIHMKSLILGLAFD